MSPGRSGARLSSARVASRRAACVAWLGALLAGVLVLSLAAARPGHAWGDAGAAGWTQPSDGVACAAAGSCLAAAAAQAAAPHPGPEDAAELRGSEWRAPLALAVAAHAHAASAVLASLAASAEPWLTEAWARALAPGAPRARPSFGLGPGLGPRLATGPPGAHG